MVCVLSVSGKETIALACEQVTMLDSIYAKKLILRTQERKLMRPAVIHHSLNQGGDAESVACVTMSTRGKTHDEITDNQIGNDWLAFPL
jgi:hypothetical protein